MKKYKLTYDGISMLCLELSLFIHAGADSAGALVLLAEESTDGAAKAMLEGMARSVDGGKKLSAAFEESGAFPRDVCAMLSVAEKTGRSEETLAALAKYYDSRSAMDRQLRAALLSPSILLIIMLAVIAVLLTKVLPIFSRVYASLGGQLTGAAGVILNLGEALRPALPVICAILAVFAVFVGLFAGAEDFRRKIMELWKKARDGKGLCAKLDTARFASSLHMALKSGMTGEEAVESAAAVFGGASAGASRCRECVEKMASGMSVSAALRESALMPAPECRLLELGMKSGSGDAAMEEAARRLEQEAEAALEKAVSAVEPVMVVVTSALVGAILLSVMLPLANILTAI